VAVGDADVGTTVGRGVTVWCGVAVRCGEAVADGLGELRCGVRLGEGVGVGAGEALCCAAAGLSPAALVALAFCDGGLTHRYSTSVPRKMATSTQVEVRTRRISRRSRCSRWVRHLPAWAAG